MESAATYRGTVYPWHCDHVGHMNIMWYVGQIRRGELESARADRTDAVLFARIRPRHGGGSAEHHLQARTAGRRHCRGQSQLLEIGEKSIRFVHEMRNAETGEIAATCEITGVHMDRQARKSTAFAETVRRAAAKLLIFSVHATPALA